MYTPPNKRSRALFTVWVKAWHGPRVGEGVTMGLFYEAWPEFYPVTQEEMASIFDSDRWRTVTYPEAAEFSRGLDRLFESIEHEAGR